MSELENTTPTTLTAPRKISPEKTNVLLQTGGPPQVRAKLSPDGHFHIGDGRGRSVTGIIIDFILYLIKFEGQTAHKLDNVIDDVDIPDGYTRRCDLTVKTVTETAGLEISISLPPTSIDRLKNYTSILRSKGYWLSDVVTKISAEVRQGKSGSYAIAKFDAIHVLEEGDIPTDLRTIDENTPQDELPEGWRE